MIVKIITLASIPWLLLGGAVMSGEIHHVLDILGFSDIGPFTFSFYVSAVGLGLFANYYIFFQNGAEQLVKHPGLFGIKPTPMAWKLYGLSIPLAHIGFFAIVYFMGDLFVPVNL